LFSSHSFSFSLYFFLSFHARNRSNLIHWQLCCLLLSVYTGCYQIYPSCQLEYMK
jgi:hypothetical protein